MRTLAEADHWILSLDPAPAMACTYFVTGQVAVNLAGGTGRAVLFPGVENLVGTLTVGEVLAVSAIDRVEVLGSGVAEETARLDTRDFVRPHFRDGQLVLTTMPAAGGLLVPFETREPTPCCVNH